MAFQVSFVKKSVNYGNVACDALEEDDSGGKCTHSKSRSCRSQTAWSAVFDVCGCSRGREVCALVVQDDCRATAHYQQIPNLGSE
eukprot:290042-Amphidinium_carterae.1